MYFSKAAENMQITVTLSGELEKKFKELIKQLHITKEAELLRMAFSFYYDNHDIEKSLNIEELLLGSDLEAFKEIKKYLESEKIYPIDIEILKMALRGYYHMITFELDFEPGKRKFITTPEAMAKMGKKEKGER